MATLLDKESSYTNVEKILFVYNGCDAGENTGIGLCWWKDGLVEKISNTNIGEKAIEMYENMKRDIPLFILKFLLGFTA